MVTREVSCPNRIGRKEVGSSKPSPSAVSPRVSPRVHSARSVPEGVRGLRWRARARPTVGVFVFRAVAVAGEVGLRAASGSEAKANGSTACSEDMLFPIGRGQRKTKDESEDMAPSLEDIN